MTRRRATMIGRRLGQHVQRWRNGPGWRPPVQSDGCRVAVEVDLGQRARRVVSRSAQGRTARPPQVEAAGNARAHVPARARSLYAILVSGGDGRMISLTPLEVLLGACTGAWPGMHRMSGSSRHSPSRPGSCRCPAARIGAAHHDDVADPGTGVALGQCEAPSTCRGQRVR